MALKRTQEIVITIGVNGEVDMETVGFKGKSCLELSRYLEQLLAGERASGDDVVRILKSEYYQAEPQRQTGIEREGSE